MWTKLSDDNLVTFTKEACGIRGITIDWKNEQKAASDTKETTYNNDKKFGKNEYDLTRAFFLDFYWSRAQRILVPRAPV